MQPPNQSQRNTGPAQPPAGHQRPGRLSTCPQRRREAFTGGHPIGRKTHRLRPEGILRGRTDQGHRLVQGKPVLTGAIERLQSSGSPKTPRRIFLDRLSFRPYVPAAGPVARAIRSMLKRLFDIVVSAAALIVGGIPMLLIALAVRMTSPGRRYSAIAGRAGAATLLLC